MNIDLYLRRGIKNNKLMRTQIFDRMVVHKEKMKETKKIIYICRMVVPCANKRNISMKTLIFGRMVAHKRKNK